MQIEQVTENDRNRFSVEIIKLNVFQKHKIERKVTEIELKSKIKKIEKYNFPVRCSAL